MPLSTSSIYLVLSDEIDATRDWYRDVLGMERLASGLRFSLLLDVPRGRDVVHIARARSSGREPEGLPRAPAQDAGAGTGALATSRSARRA